MKKTLLYFGCMMLLAAAMAQETRIDKTNATTAEDDGKENSETVPESYGIESNIEKVIVARMKYKTDLLAGLEDVVKEHDIKNAVILSGIGSVRGYHIHQVINRTFPSKNAYVKDPTAPADLIGTNGYIIDGRIHAHITLADPEKSFGGHLEPGTEVFTFAIITIGILSEDTDLSEVDRKHYR
ncbi:MAG: DNA-binding protein [Cyclobacteriaceae bacterium]